MERGEIEDLPLNFDDSRPNLKLQINGPNPLFIVFTKFENSIQYNRISAIPENQHGNFNSSSKLLKMTPPKGKSQEAS
ncbi:Epimerase domain-containing protein [Psidium guajava]|nr:Epimerase domain-containing protein [Psidium guajava]